MAFCSSFKVPDSEMVKKERKTRSIKKVESNDIYSKIISLSTLFLDFNDSIVLINDEKYISEIEIFLKDVEKISILEKREEYESFLLSRILNLIRSLKFSNIEIKNADIIIESVRKRYTREFDSETPILSKISRKKKTAFGSVNKLNSREVFISGIELRDFNKTLTSSLDVIDNEYEILKRNSLQNFNYFFNFFKEKCDLDILIMLNMIPKMYPNIRNISSLIVFLFFSILDIFFVRVDRRGCGENQYVARDAR